MRAGPRHAGHHAQKGGREEAEISEQKGKWEKLENKQLERERREQTAKHRKDLKRNLHEPCSLLSWPHASLLTPRNRVPCTKRKIKDKQPGKKKKQQQKLN